MIEALRPSTLGERPDCTFQIYRRKFPRLAAVGAIPSAMMRAFHVAGLQWVNSTSLIQQSSETQLGRTFMGLLAGLAFFHISSLVILPLWVAFVLGADVHLCHGLDLECRVPGPMGTLFPVLAIPPARSAQFYETVYYVFREGIHALVTPLYAIAVTLIYYDQRIRHEGFDIEIMMVRAGMIAAAAAATAEPSPQEQSA